MIGDQLALIRREIWEHRSIYVTPIAIAVIVSLVSLAGMVTVSAFDKEVHMALFGASNIAGDAERQAALTVFFVGTSWRRSSAASRVVSGISSAGSARIDSASATSKPWRR